MIIELAALNWLAIALCVVIGQIILTVGLPPCSPNLGPKPMAPQTKRNMPPKSRCIPTGSVWSV